MLIAMMAETYGTIRSKAMERTKWLLAVQVLQAEKSVLRKGIEWYHGKRIGEMRPDHHFERPLPGVTDAGSFSTSVAPGKVEGLCSCFKSPESEQGSMTWAMQIEYRVEHAEPW